MQAIIIPLAVIAGLLVAIVGTGFFIKSKISKFSRQAFGTDNIMEGYREQKRKLSETPRSVQSMTGIYGPEILRDFPDFDLDLYRNKAKTVLRGYLNAIATRSADTLPEEITPTLKNHILEIIENLELNRRTQYYLEPVVHACEIGRYRKTGGEVVITFNTAVGLYAYLEDENGKVINGDKDNKLQTLYEIDLRRGTGTDLPQLRRSHKEPRSEVLRLLRHGRHRGQHPRVEVQRRKGTDQAQNSVLISIDSSVPLLSVRLWTERQFGNVGQTPRYSAGA